jgi:GNAT superfamily N-acetyltransferase
MKIEALGSAHERGGFRAGVPVLDRYFRHQAGRDAARRLAAVFVLVMPGGGVAGYYTLAPATVLLPDLLGASERKASRYPPMAAARLSRLMVDERQRGQGFARAMLADALHRVWRSGLDVVALIADAPDEAARAFYLRAGLLPFPDREDRLFRPMADLPL